MNNSSSYWFNHSLRLLHHELRRGELTIIFLAIVLAVATVFSLSGFSEQIKQAIMASSTNTIAADRVLRTSKVLDTEILEQSKQQSLSMSRKLETESMAFYGDNMLLSELSVVDENYPLRGKLKGRTSLESDVIELSAPKQGTVWVEPSVLSRLDTAIGETIEIGAAQLVIAGVATDIPDRSYSMFIAGPSILINNKDLDATQLLQPGSRTFFKYLFAGELSDLEAFDEWVKPKLNDTQRWYDAKRAQNRLSRVLDSAEKFLSLASMLGIVLAAVAVAVASRRYGQRHQPTVAVFKAIGASMSHIRKVYVLHWTMLSLLSIAVGLLLGYGLILMGISAIQAYLDLDQTALTSKPFSIAIATGLICSVAFAIHPMKSLIDTAPLAVIRGFSKEKLGKFGVHQVIPLVALFGLLYMFSGDLKMSLSLLAGGLLASLVLLGFGRLLMSAGRSVGAKAGKSWHLALANLKRRAGENSVQLVSFTIAIKLLLLITVMKSSLFDEWEAQFPPETPNHYLLNIANNQVEPLAAFTESESIDNQGFYEIYRGRLTAINGEQTQTLEQREAENEREEKGESASENAEGESSTRRGMGRELGLTWRDELPIENEITEGAWWNAEDTSPQVSIAKGVAERLEIKLNDQLTFTVGVHEFTVPVTSIREVNWQSRQLNFVMIFNEPVFQNIETTSISAWKVEDSERDKVYRFLANFPTISIMDFDAIMKQLNTMIEQVSVAIELILLLVVLAGSLVLIAQVQASMEERERELAILRTLGAKGSLLRNSVLYEFVALGAIAGLMASFAMEIAVFFLQTEVFDMDPSLHLEFWLMGIGVGAVFVGLMGMLSCWRLLNLSSVTLIRRTM